MSQFGNVVAGALLMTFGCSEGPTAPTSQTPDLAAAPSNVVISGKRLTLNASLWRDFMPISPPDGKPLSGVLRVQTDDGASVPVDVHADSAWVVHGSETWSTVPREERPRSETLPVYEVVVRDGPKWGPHVGVDVVVRLVDASGRTRLLSARSQTIGATF